MIMRPIEWDRPLTAQRLPWLMDRAPGYHVHTCVEFAHRTRKTMRMHVIPSKVCGIGGPLFNSKALCDALTLYIMTRYPYTRNLKVHMCSKDGVPVGHTRLFTRGELAQTMLVTDVFHP